MTHELGYFGPSPHIPRRGGRPSLLNSLLLGTVIGLVGFGLLCLAAPKFNSGRGDARACAAKTDLANFSTALDAFASDTGRYPTDAESLAALVSPPGGPAEGKEPYLQQIQNDPWGRPYVYHLGGPAGGPGYRIVCMGPDGREATEDDIDGGCDEAAPVRDGPAALSQPAERRTTPCATAASPSNTR